MPPKRTNDVAKDSVRKTRFKECNPALKVVKPKPVRVRGFWTDQKELELLKEYARLFPPACKRGMHSKAWAKIINCVNGLTPDEPPLSYDTCRRAVDRLVESYKKNLSERLVGSDQNKNRTEAEMAVYKIIKQRALHEAAKKSGRPQEFIRQENDLEGEECRSVSIPTGERRNGPQEAYWDHCRDSEGISEAGQPECFSPSLVQTNDAFVVNEDDFVAAQQKYRDEMLISSRNQEMRLSNVENRLSNIERLLEKLVENKQ